ncbi:MAG: hypothetical protein R3Y60_03125 [bacterium]
MSTQIVIKSKSFFKDKINFLEMILSLNLKFGAYDENSNLIGGKFYAENQAVLFNPECLGMGIIFDGYRLNKGIVGIIIQPYTTESEINDVYKIINYICKKYKKSNIYLNDEYITLGVLEEFKSRIIELSLENLKLGCKRTVDCITHMRLALTNFDVSEEFRDTFGYIENLKEFEEYIHNLQKEINYGS